MFILGHRLLNWANTGFAWNFQIFLNKASPVKCQSFKYLLSARTKHFSKDKVRFYGKCPFSGWHLWRGQKSEIDVIWIKLHTFQLICLTNTGKVSSCYELHIESYKILKTKIVKICPKTPLSNYPRLKLVHCVLFHSLATSLDVIKAT